MRSQNGYIEAGEAQNHLGAPFDNPASMAIGWSNSRRILSNATYWAHHFH
ncbi:hypothetical protein [Terracidiphilus gabretensis]|nr:hypothetical protein [Terracidiphilus gabretensis]